MSGTNVFGTACKTCRRRGRKCDRTLPTCTSCAKKGINCEGYVLRWVGVAARGSLAGQAYTTNKDALPLHHGEKSSKTERPHAKIDSAESLPPAGDYQYQTKVAQTSKPSVTCTHFAGDVTPDAQRNTSRAITSLRQQNWSLSDGEISGDNLQELVEYYGRGLGEAFYQGQHEGPVETPYTSHILPLTRSIPSVRWAVAALASCHIANRLDDEHLKRQSLQLRVKASQFLRAELMSGDERSDLGCLACMMLLAQLDLCSGDCMEFGTHLEAASKFVKSRGSDGTERGFFEQRLAWLDIMGATTTPRMPYWTSKDIKAALNKFRSPEGREWGFDVFYCPIDLLEYIADITVLYKVEPDPSNISQDVIQKAISFGRAVKTWDASNYSAARSHIVEVWRFGTLLYLIRLFHLRNGIFDTVGLIRSLFSCARAVPIRTSWNVSTSWPLFQAGLLLSHEDDENKAWLRDEFHANFQNLGCFNLHRTVTILERVWQMGDDETYDPFTFDSPELMLIL